MFTLFVLRVLGDNSEHRMSILEKAGQALAGIQSLTVAECERVFKCELRLDQANPRQYWGTCLDLNIEVLDVRLGQTGGIVVARFDESMQPALAEAVRSLGVPEDIDIVSPPLSPASASAWSRKWSEAYMIAGAKIWFGLEEIDGSSRLAFVSRSFTTSQTPH